MTRRTTRLRVRWVRKRRRSCAGSNDSSRTVEADRRRGWPALCSRFDSASPDRTQDTTSSARWFDHWSCRRMAQALGVSKKKVQRVSSQLRLKPHRLNRHMASDDPAFEQEAADIIGLYMKPPKHAAVFCVDEKTAIQVLDRLDALLPMSMAERHGSEFHRHGTLSLYAALHVKSDQLQRKTAGFNTTKSSFFSPRAGGADVVGQRDPHRAGQSLRPRDQRRGTVPAEHKGALALHPTYSAWLNQVELWFAKLQRDVIRCGVFASVDDLGNRLRRYIRVYSTIREAFAMDLHRHHTQKSH
jgi:hypothetical protein